MTVSPKGSGRFFPKTGIGDKILIIMILLLLVFAFAVSMVVGYNG